MTACWHGIEPTYRPCDVPVALPREVLGHYAIVIVPPKRKECNREDCISCKTYLGIFHNRLETLLYLGLLSEWLEVKSDFSTIPDKTQVSDNVAFPSSHSALLGSLPLTGSPTSTTCRFNAISHKQFTLNTQLLRQRKAGLKHLRNISLLAMVITIS